MRKTKAAVKWETLFRGSFTVHFVPITGRIFTGNHIFSHERRLFNVITWRSSACNKRPHRIYCN